MTQEEHLRTVILNDTVLNGLIGGRVFPVMIPQGEGNVPCLVYHLISENANYAQGGNAFDKHLVQFSGFGTSWTQVKTLMLNLRRVLEFYSGTVGDSKIYYIEFAGMGVETQEVDTRYWHISNDYSYLIKL